MDKYFLLSPWPAGFSNVVSSYEIGFAIAHITNRKIIIPPTNWCVLIDERESEPKDWQNIWEIYDKEQAKKEFDIIDLLDFEDFKPFIKELTFCKDKNDQNYTWYKNIEYIKNYRGFANFTESNVCLYNSQNQYTNNDFNTFSKNRQLLDLNSDEKFIKLSGFGHYWYHVYPGGPAERNKMKKRVNNSLKFKEIYYKMVKDSLTTKNIKYFNAVHIRSPWQLMYDDQPEKTVNFRDSKQNFLQQIEILFDASIPLYIATDIEDKSFFDALKTKFNIFFIEDLNLSNLSPLEKIAIDKITCFYAEKFYGSYFSTFSKRINALRGIHNKKEFDFMGFNKISNYDRNILDFFPWNKEKDEFWHWYKDSYLQWTFE